MNRKKTELLLPLSQEYGQALDFCGHIRRGFRLSVDAKRMKIYSNWFFQGNLKAHFEMEEDFIFALLTDREDVVVKARAYQRKLKRLFLSQNEIERSLNLSEELLEAYVRFERNRLMDLMIRKIDSRKLNLIMNIYSDSVRYEDWGDCFWEN